MFRANNNEGTKKKFSGKFHCRNHLLGMEGRQNLPRRAFPKLRDLPHAEMAGIARQKDVRIKKTSHQYHTKQDASTR